MGQATDGALALDAKQKLAYDVLNDFFHRHENDVVEIEVLPPALAPPDGSLILEDGICVGIPKKVVAGAFAAARLIFFRNRDKKDGNSIQSALDATRVMLLFDPEHLTAANFRKTRLYDSALGLVRPDEHARLIRLEFNFLDSILTSPLHRQSKSPTLWHHRCWLIRTFNIWICVSRGRTEEEKHSPHEAFAHELDVVLKSGARHPKNYYAWQYGRYFFDRLDYWIKSPIGPRLQQLVSTESKPLMLVLLESSTQKVYQWCTRNPSDTSAWSFLLFLLRRAPQDQSTPQQIVDRTLNLAQDFRWRHESVWVFLRSVIADAELIPKAEMEKYLHELAERYQRNAHMPPECRPIISAETPHPATKALQWIRKNTSP